MSIVLKLARPGGSTRDPVDSGLEPRRVYEKIGIVKNLIDSVKNPVVIY